MSDYQGKQSQGNDLVYWLIAIALCITGVAAPVGVVMIVLKLLSGGRNKKRGRHPYYTQRDAQDRAEARTAAAEPGAEAPASGAKGKKGAAARSPTAKLLKDGKGLTSTGIALTAAFGCITIINAVDNLWLLPGDILWFLEEIVPLLCFTGLGVGFLLAGLGKTRKARRYRNYLAMVGQRQCVSVSALASAAGLSTSRVRDDLEDMLSEGIFPGGFLDYGGDMLVLSGEGVCEPPKPRQEPEPHEQGQEDAILAEIRAVNDAIANQKLSGQIDRIGVITAKILDYQKSHPAKSPQLHSFLSYYLPTTLKILRAYGQLEAQEVNGENITAAMERIEGMMDKVVEGFEKQLDLLFQGDAMDITADVEVLERMLAKDGLSDQSGMTLGL